MLIIASLNLPSTVLFESDELISNLEEQRNTFQSAQSLVRNEPEPTEPEAEVPFDFEETEALHDANGSSHLSGAHSNSNNSSGHNNHHHQSNKSNRSDSSSGSKPNLTKWNSELDQLQKSLQNRQSQIQASSEIHHFPSFVLAHQGSPGDYDTIVEQEMLEKGAGLNVRRRSSTITALRKRIGSVDIATSQKFRVVPDKGSNRGLFNALDAAIEKGKVEKYKSVGFIGMSSDSMNDHTKHDIAKALKEERDNYVVYASDAERRGHYDIYCKEFMWPTFHCLTPDIPKSKSYEESSWGSYVAVNQLIADKVVEAYEMGDTIWVHDYHLMLVPQMVREKLPNAPIGFFLHIAFPSSEVFRSLAYRAELLSGVLAANLIGFHIPEYMQHFKMSLARILTVDITGVGVVETPDHDAVVAAQPLGIDTIRLAKTLAVDDPESAVQQHRRVIRARWPTQVIIAARDKTDPIRGLPQKLRAFDRFLSENPHWADRVVLVQICTTGGNSSEIDMIVDKINSRYGDIASGIQPVVLLKQDIKFEQYLALLCEANGFCVTCLRDGMNLTCHEFAEANMRMGPLILSEFTGSASVLGSSALLVNPWDQEQLVQAFKSCVEMPRWEREKRWLGLKKAVEQHTAADWAINMTEQITQAWQDEKSRQCHAPILQELDKLYHGVGQNERRLFLLEAERPSTVEAEKRLIEQSGDSLNKGYVNSPNAPKSGPYYTTRLPLAIRELCSDPRNIVYVISPETPDFMERMFRALPGLGLISEFGKCVRMSGEEEWIELSNGDTQSGWKLKVEPYLKQLKERGLVSDIAVQTSSIIVEFNTQRDSSGDAREHSIVGEYMSLINDQYSGEAQVRTKLEGCTLTLYCNTLGKIRQTAFQHILNSIKDPIGLTFMANQPYSCDAEDIVYQWAESLKDLNLSREIVTLSVGKHPSLAQYMVEGTNALLNLLHTIRTREDVKGPRNVSKFTK